MSVLKNFFAYNDTTVFASFCLVFNQSMEQNAISGPKRPSSLEDKNYLN